MPDLIEVNADRHEFIAACPACGAESERGDEDTVMAWHHVCEALSALPTAEQVLGILHDRTVTPSG